MQRRTLRWTAAVLTCALWSCDDGATATSSSSSSSSGSGGSGGEKGLVCVSPSITKGPWALHVDGTSAKIRWEACAAGTPADVTIEREGGSDPPVTVTAVESTVTLENTYPAPLDSKAPPDWAGTYYMHEATVTGLQAGACYGYSLAADATRKGRFCTAHPSGDPLRFMVIGDTNPALGTTAKTLSHALPEKPEFVLHGGDIQYYASTLETWALWFPIMQPMLSQGAFFPAIGNHESEKSDELSLYALRFFGGAGFDGGDTYYRFENAGVWFFSVNTELPLDPVSEQGVWLATSLADAASKPGYRFSVIYFHKPFRTCGDTGDNETAYQAFEPLFLQHKVMFVLQAHMHGYERFELPDGMTYITSAGGGGVITNVDENIERPYCKDRVKSGGFYHAMIMDVGATTVTGKVIDADGVVQDTFTKMIP
ncbi:MAG: metallophosphoesterase [Polyangiaceae bacterium]